MDMTMIGFNTIYLISSQQGTLEEWHTFMACYGTIILYIKLFYWMRAFTPFTTFVRIILDMLKDVKVFAVMLFFVLMGFGNVMMIINARRHMDYVNDKMSGMNVSFDSYTLIGESTGIATVDALINAWLLLLGEFSGLDNYPGPYSKSVFLIFVAATIIG